MQWIIQFINYFHQNGHYCVLRLDSNERAEYFNANHKRPEHWIMDGLFVIVSSPRPFLRFPQTIRFKKQK